MIKQIKQNLLKGESPIFWCALDAFQCLRRAFFSNFGLVNDPYLEIGVFKFWYSWMQTTVLLSIMKIVNIFFNRHWIWQVTILKYFIFGQFEHLLKELGLRLNLLTLRGNQIIRNSSNSSNSSEILIYWKKILPVKKDDVYLLRWIYFSFS